MTNFSLYQICDFGLARIMEGNSSSPDSRPLVTGYVTTRFYRAPEVVLHWQSYQKSSLLTLLLQNFFSDFHFSKNFS